MSIFTIMLLPTCPCASSYLHGSRNNAIYPCRLQVFNLHYNMSLMHHRQLSVAPRTWRGQQLLLRPPSIAARLHKAPYRGQQCQASVWAKFDAIFVLDRQGLAQSHNHTAWVAHTRFLCALMCNNTFGDTSHSHSNKTLDHHSTWQDSSM